MPDMSAADTIRILVSTDNHVGYNERDAIRGDDSWKSFNEVMELAKKHDVDMVLLAGDLFHENKPSRKSMYQVMRSLRMNCYGEKPCELEMLSDASETFAGPFNHVNYEDPDINVAIPVFSIHGNHDDPSGEGHLAALDILQMSGLVNYYGRTPESDNILIKPVLLQKGRTKLALYGMSNVRDERLFRTFRSGNVKFFQPGTQVDDWFNLMSVHQNAHAYTETNYLPQNFLPSFLDLVVWGHEHECLIDPQLNPETNFRVMQPGSSVATSLVQGEAVPKHVAILTVTGKHFTSENIRLKTVRPFVMREIVLSENREMRDVAAANDDPKPKITRYLIAQVEEMIEEANEQWQEARREANAINGVSDADDDNEKPPLPLIRLRVEYTAPDGGNFETENPQRFSNRFIGKVANVNDVVQFHRKKKSGAARTGGKADNPEESVMAQIQMDTVKIERLVQEFLTAQSLTILPQNNFSDAVNQFVDKDDKDAMKHFIDAALLEQVGFLIKGGAGGEAGGDDDADLDEEHMMELMEQFKMRREDMFAKGEIQRPKKPKGSRKPRPDYWDSDMNGEWEDDPASLIRESVQPEDDDDDASVVSGAARGKATGRGRSGKAATTRGGKAAAAKKAPAAKPAPKGRGKKKPVSESEEEEPDVIMLDDDDDDDEDDDDEETMFVRQAPKKAAAPAKAKPAPKPRATAASKQSQLSFAQPQSTGRASSGRAAAAAATTKAAPARRSGISEDEISDDDDAFEAPAPSSRAPRRR